MGGSSSTMKSPEKVFEKELNNIESIINKIITKNDKFVDPSYNFMDDSVCNDYTMVVEDKLNKHLKIHLHDLASNIYFVPKKMNEVTLKNQNITKKELCSIITSHYTRTLKILSMIREMYDIENGGDYSLPGILFRNIDNVDGMFQVSYCGMNQEPLDGGERVDFSKLKGLKRFVDEMLTEEEARTFLLHLKQLFGNMNKRKISELICKDTLLSLETYQMIYEGIPIDMRCQTGGGVSGNHFMFFVAKDKPIISYELCYDKQKMMIPYDKTIKSLFQKFKSDYLVNLNGVTSIIHKLISFDKSSKSYKLNDLSHDQLIAIEMELKRNVMVFYIQSMVNYYKIFNYIKNNKHLKQ